ncbi:MAG TPA: tetratricopeptide repeat protein [Blastocatellia bacterium]|nr:tetratricopeptide repeat protein [Blastocatellia bacterium]
MHKVVLSTSIVILGLISGGCGVGAESVSRPVQPAPAMVALPSDTESTESAIRFLEKRVSLDHDDFMAYNKLAEFYMKRQRETGSLNYLDLALRAARASLAAMPEEQNKSGLAALGQAEFASHDFASARSRAERLVELDRSKSYPYQMMGDALTELGDYENARAAYNRMSQISGGVSTETRLAREELLRGRPADAEKRLSVALALTRDQDSPPRETVAWIRWELGEVAYSIGDYSSAERYCRDALETFPDYYRALAGLARARAAQGDLEGAMEYYQRAIQIVPDPTFIAALGDVYRLAGRDRDAQGQYALVEHIGKLSELNGVLYNRQLAIFYADHDIKPPEAYQQAMREYAIRRDIYGADAVAWTALKAGKVAEAQSAAKEALKLGTRDSKIYYHAGMIALAAGDQATARDYLNRALTLSPHFDPLQELNARKALESIGD